MTTDNPIEQGKIWLAEFNTEDLSRGIIREFLLQNHLQQTLQVLEEQDTRNRKKINKSTLIKMLNLNNLVFNNKQAEKPYRSLLEILVGYLKSKFQDRIENLNDMSISQATTKKSDFSNLNSNIVKEELQSKQKSLNNTMCLTKAKNQGNLNKQQKKSLKGKSKGIQTKSVSNIYAQLQKQNENERLKKSDEEKQKRIVQLQKEREMEKNANMILEKEKQKLQMQIERLRKNLQIKQDEKLRLEERMRSECLEREREIGQLRREKDKEIKEMQGKIKGIQKKNQELLKEIAVLKMRKQVVDKQADPIGNVDPIVNTKKVDPIVNVQQVNPIINVQQVDAKIKSNEITSKITKSIEKQKEEKNQPTQLNGRVGLMKKMSKKAVIQQKDKIEQKTQVNPNALEKNKIEQKTQVNPNALEAKPLKNPQSNKESEPKMVKMFGKKKKDESNGEEPTKFKFDENFVDKPLHQVGEKYQYEKMLFTKMTVKDPPRPQINYRQKKPASTKKYPQKLITEQKAQMLKKILFQEGSSVLPKAWSQGFILSPHQNTPYGLAQIEGGPCGIIAALQCYFLKHLISYANPADEQQLRNQIIRQNSLVAAFSDILMKVKSSDKVYLAVLSKSFSSNKIDYFNLRVITIEATSFSAVFEALWFHRSYFIGKANHGVTFLLLSIILTKGIENIEPELDMIQSPLIGNHGHCTQELVNLFITGKASSNVFDGNKILDSEMVLHGITEKSEFGFLTVFETLQYVSVGSNLKNPIYPFWIICKQFHYHVIFANNYLIAENSQTEKFDIVYFDGLYNCADRIVITLEKYPYGEEPEVKVKDLPLIEQVMMTKWGIRKADWNGSIKIL